MNDNVIKYVKGQSSMINWMKRRIKRNQNVLTTIYGETGSGKSFALIEMGSKIDPEFDPKEQIAFLFKDLMRIINNYNDPNHPLSKRKYKYIGFDDCQTDISNKEWQSKINKLFNYLLSTFRHQNFILIFTSPYMDFLDSSAMKLIHCTIETKGFNKKTKKSKLRPLFQEYNSKKKKFYYHSLYVRRDGRENKMKYWIVKCPPKDIVNSYEECKIGFTNALNKRITEELAGIDKKKEKKDDRKPLTDKQKNVLEGLAKHKGNVKEFSLASGIDTRNIYFHVQQSTKKDYNWKEFQ